ncbi:MAG: hypothetical protein HGA81_00910 [Chlorobium limicola]|nr:hypothetical protein [Chlorobium limicola]
MTPDELHSLLLPENLNLLEEHGSDDPSSFALRFQGRADIPARAIAEQLDCRRRALKKLPVLSQKGLLYTAPALEQSSGEAAATYKASLMGGERLIDLTGGLGIDAVFFSRVFRNVVYCERDPLLAELAAYNFRRLGVSNVEICQGDSLAMLHSFSDDHFDWMYVDPSRREGGRRSVGLSAASPDVAASHDLLLRKAAKVMVKASPALELSGIERQLPSISAIHVVSVGGECRETLLLLERTPARQGPIARKAVLLDTTAGEWREIAGTGWESRSPAVPVQAFFYEPGPAIIKSALTARLSEVYGFDYVSNTVDYLTSNRFVEGFPGRTFRVVASDRYKPKTFRSFLQRHGIRGAAIQRRDFPLSPEEIRRKFRLRESHCDYLFFTKDSAGESICVYAVKPSPAGGEAPSVQGRNAAPEC